MGIKLKRAMVGAAASALAFSTLAACGGDGGSGNGAGQEGEKGGELVYLQHFAFESADPQRIYYGVQLAQWRRTLYRGLLGFPMSEDAEEANTPVPDLATDTGTAEEGGKVWSFTLKDGVKWEDGSDITCEDVKYGTSRVFANDVITGGPNYTLSYLDIPTKPDGSSQYPGPYKATPEQQAMYDKAVTCDDRTITFRFNKPWADFPLAVAGMMMTDPYKESFDEGDKSQWKVLSNGPYKVEGGVWDKNKGATLVRNPEYDPSTDDPETLRLALPDRIDWQVSTSDDAGELYNERLIKDSGDDQRAITSARLTPAQLKAVDGNERVQERYINVESPYVDYFSINHKTLTNPKVREALVVGLNSVAYNKALGGEKVAVPAETIVNPSLTGYQPNPAFEGDNDNNGDPEAAKQLLEEAGVKTPYPIKLSYQKSPTYDKAMSIVKEAWDEAGFKVELDGLSDTYYDVIADPDKDTDVAWAGWGADWPSMMTVLPPLFDSRPNISATSCNNNYGCYKSDEFNSLVDQAANAATIEEQIGFLQEADKVLGEDVAYIPLDVQKFNWLHGSKVTGFTTTAASSSYPEIGLIGVEQ
ncbi:ABC transporter substrate-binding protein [Nocardioides sp. SYSU DS0651]|uniref:ABC transporter substrate-binding protein n=1 Tax=Nocardioides sp. SYSU DS0651 TaxID=3415955 RepID=UPI003F4B1CE4